MANRMARFYAYSNRVYDLEQRLTRVRDGRCAPTHPLRPLMLKMIGGIITGLGSFNQLEERIHEGDLDPLGGSGRPSAETFSYAFARLDQEPLGELAGLIATQARHNKALDATRIEGFRVIAIDGTGCFSTVSQRLGKHAHYRQDAHGETTRSKQYYEHALAVSYVGGKGPKPLLSLTRIPKGQGETTVARQELRRLHARHGGFYDVATLDAGFAQAPILNLIFGQHRHFVVRVKQENYRIIQDANGLFKGCGANEHHEQIRLRKKQVIFDLEIWDEEGLTSWENVDAPLRCVKVKQTRTKLDAAGSAVETEETVTHLVTNATKATMPALTVWKIAHLRWDVENTGFHVLKHHFGLEHAYSYDPAVIQVVYDLYAIAYNLFQLFVHRNLRDVDRKRRTLRGLMRDLYKGLVQLATPLGWSNPAPEPG